MGNKKKQVFKGKLLKVYKTVRRLPSGVNVNLEEVAHPGAALVVPFLSKRIVFLYQYRPILGKYLWELPAGKLDPGETSLSCAKREVQEETGYKIEDIKKLGFIYTSPGFTDEKIVIYRANCSEKTEPMPDEDELIKVKVLSVGALRKIVRSGKIVDSKTLSALYLAGLM